MMQPRSRRTNLLLAALVSGAIFAVMALTVADTAPWQGEGDSDTSGLANDTKAIADTLFGAQVIAFEILGILLTAAMIGALVIARPLGVAPDEDNYTHPTPDQLRQSLAVSDVGSHHVSTTPPPATKEAGP